MTAGEPEAVPAPLPAGAALTIATLDSPTELSARLTVPLLVLLCLSELCGARVRTDSSFCNSSHFGSDRCNVADGWEPIHESHAIDVMAVVVTFGQIIPSLLLKRTLRIGEEAAVAAGLRGRHGLRQVMIGPDGTTSPPVQGQIFNSLADVSDDSAPPQIAEQLHIAQDKVMYRTWRYVSWSWQFERIQKLLLPLISAVQDSVPISTQRFEYLDRFRWDGDSSQIDYSKILRADSPLIAPHVFSRPDLWHSYTGAFLPNGSDRKKVMQLQIDALDGPSPTQASSPQARWLHIMTAREDRFNMQEVDEDQQQADIIGQTFDSMHGELKELLATLISDAMIERIYLWKS